MKITNERGLPRPILNALMNDPYSKGESDFTVTELISPPRQNALKRKYWDVLTEDASDRVWSLLGQAVHHIAEQGVTKDFISEERFYANILGFNIGGQCDLYDKETGTLYDYKCTSAWGFISKNGGGRKPEYEQQLNMLASLLRHNGYPVDRLVIIGVLRDWDQKCLDPVNKRFFKEGYPKAPIVEVGQKIWKDEDCLKFFVERIKLHRDAIKHLEKNDQKDLIKCSKEEIWGGRRCIQYCLASDFCDQYKEIKTTGVMT